MHRKTIGIGIDDFKEVIEGNHYLIDKSLLIKEAMTDGSKVILFPRPRRWGKTLNMSMLNCFFEKKTQSNRYLFCGLAIEQYPEMMEHQGQYPVISLSLKEAKKNTWEACYDMLQDVLTKAYEKHAYLLDSHRLTQSQRHAYAAILNKTGSQAIYERSLYELCSYLHRYHEQKPIILIDEYDAPIQAGFTHDFYSQVINFMRTLLSAAFKGNSHLKKGFLTGILRVSKESIFSGLNNLLVCTLLNNEYAEHFGFSESEVKTLLEYYECADALDSVREWYNGYRMGPDTTVYNPWSVLSFAKRKELSSHWMGMSDNLLVKEIIQKTPASFKEDLEQLLRGERIEKRVMDFVTFDDVFTYPDVAHNFLLLTGYLSFEKKYRLDDDETYISLVIPNKEVRLYYRNTITSWIQETLDLSTYQNMLKSLISGDIKDFKRLFERTVLYSLSFHDVSGKEQEKFYHMFVLGMLVSLQDSHQVLSNRESGSGRYDVMVIPRNIEKIGIIIEFKIVDDETKLEEGAMEGLQQMRDRHYKAELEARGVTQIIHVAIAFSGKRVLVQYEL